MALTRYRLPASGAAAVSPAFQSYTHTQSVRRPLPTSDATALATQAYTPDAADDTNPGDAHHVQFVSDALATGTVYDVGNRIAFAVQALEDHANNNLNVQIWVGVYSNDGATLRQTLLGKTEEPTELATSLTNRAHVATVANAYTTVSGDRLVVEFSVEGDAGGGGGVQGHNASIRWGSDGGSGDLPENDTETGTGFNPWFEIETVTAVTITPAAVAATFIAAAPTIVLGSLTLLPGAASARFVAAAPTMALGSVTLTPDAVVAIFAVPAPTLVESSAVEILPEPVVARLAAAAPVLVLGSSVVLADPVVARFLAAAPSMALGSVTLLPGAAVARFVIPAPTVEGGAAGEEVCLYFRYY